MIIRARNLLFIGLAFLGLTSCKDPAFLHKVVETSSPTISNQYRIKDMVGGAADIVWLIDNSGSMEFYQNNVILNMDLFIQAFLPQVRGMDWRMGLISTDVRNQPYLGFTQADRLDANTADPVATFQSAVRRLGTYGSGTEQAYDPIRRHLIGHPDFLRPHAKLFLILISDEEEQSRISTNEFINYLVATKGSLERIITYGFFGMEHLSCSNTAYTSGRYEEFMLATKGKAHPICLPDYGPVLAAIGRDIGERISIPQINLPDRPKISTLKVFFRDQELPGGPRASGGYWFYNYDWNAVVFHSLDFASGTQENVRIVYER